MPTLRIILDGDGCWPDADPAQPHVHFDQQTALAVARLPGGMSSGNGSVSIRLDMPDGSIIIAQTSERLFLAAADAFRAVAEMERKANARAH